MIRGSRHNRPWRRWLALWAALSFVLAEVAFAAHEIDHLEVPAADCLEAACGLCDLEASNTAPLRPSATNGVLTPLPLLVQAISIVEGQVNRSILPGDPGAPRAPPLHA